MACMPLVERGRIVGVICGFEPVYRFRGFLFELHSYHGPIPLRRDNLEPRLTIPRGFWDAWEEFRLLLEGDRCRYLVSQEELSR